MKNTTLTLALLLCACASTDGGYHPAAPPSATEQKLAAAKCCSDLETAPLTALPATGTFVDIDIGNDDSLISTKGTGRSFFKLFRLPADRSAYYFRLESFGLKGEIFAPVVVILNEDFSVSRRSTYQMLRYTRENKLWNTPERFHMYFRLDVEDGSKEKYFLIASDERTYGKHFHFRVVPAPNTTFYYPIGLSQMPTRAEGAPEVRATPGGLVRLFNSSSWRHKPGDAAFLF